MAYTNTFIQVAPDTKATKSEVPIAKGDKKTIHQIQYELLTENPYQLTHEDLIYEVYVRRQGFSEEELAARGETIRSELFQKEHACLRASALTKRYGWGAHYNENGKIALYPMESPEYTKLTETTPKILDAMRSKRR